MSELRKTIDDITRTKSSLDSTDRFVGRDSSGDFKSTIQNIIDSVSIGGWLTKIVTSSTYTVTDSDMSSYNEIMFDTTSNSITVTLPDRATQNGKKIKLSHAIQGSTNIVTINRAGGDTITRDGLTSIELPEEQNYVELFASSIISAWCILNESISSELFLYTSAGYGTTDTAIEKFTNSSIDIGNMFSNNHGSYGTAGLEITINRTGKYAITYNTVYSSAYTFGLSLNSSELTTTINAITNTEDILTMSYTIANNAQGSTSITKRFSKDDVIRPHGNNVAYGTAANDERARIRVSYTGQ